MKVLGRQSRRDIGGLRGHRAGAAVGVECDGVVGQGRISNGYRDNV